MTNLRHTVELTARRSRVLAELLLQTSTLSRRLEWSNDAQLRDGGNKLRIAVDRFVVTMPDRATDRLRISLTELANSSDEVHREMLGHLLRVSERSHVE